MKSAVWPLIQMNVPEGFLDPVKDKKPQTSEQELAEKVEKMILPRHKSACFKHELKNGPTRILAVAVWLKLKRKYFSTGTAKVACELFQVRVKQLSRVLTGHKYLGGKKTPVQKEWGKKRKDAPLLTLPRGPRRAEMTRTNHPSKADHLSTCTAHQRSQNKQIIHYHLQLKCIHLIKCTKVLKRHGIFIHPSHHSLFTVSVQVAHSGALS